MKTNKQYYINGFVNSLLTEQEQNELSLLIKKGVVNEQELHDYKQIVTTTKKAETPIFKTPDKFIPTQKTAKIRAINYSTIIKVAAVLVLGMGLGIIGMNYFNPGKNQFIYAETKQGDRISITLPGENHIYLNGQSSVKYRASFSGSDRIIDLKGEAYFQLPEIQNSPVIVKCNDAKIICYQGSFNVENNVAKEKIEIEVEKGWVTISHPDIPEKQCIVEAGSKGVMDKFIPIWVEKNQNQNYMAWYTGKMVFKQSTLNEVANTLSEVYDIPVEIKGSYGNCFFNNSFNQATLDEVLHSIESTLKYNIQKKKNKIIITGKPCSSNQLKM